tara:strand:+ start:10373 stop:10888 length:516 start_codon:yes stop_codon:yes gene_type:complete
MAVAAAVATVASAGLSAYSSYQQQKAAKQQANYQAAVARNNVIIAKHNQIRIKQQADEAEAEQRRRTSQFKGAIRASAAGSGLLVDDTQDSTVQGLLADANAEGAYDILKIRDTRENEIRNAKIQGMEYQAKADLFSAKASSYNPAMAAAGTLLGSSGDVYSAGQNAKWWS